jgi:hypothetical protein
MDFMLSQVAENISFFFFFTTLKKNNSASRFKNAEKPPQKTASDFPFSLKIK